MTSKRRRGAGAASPFPRVASFVETAWSSGGTTHTVSLPSGIVSGSLVIIVTELDTASGVGQSISGFTELLDTGAASSSPPTAISYKFCTGGEGATIGVSLGSAVTNSITYAMRISGHHASQAPELLKSTASTFNPDPPSVTASWGSDDNLWLAFCATPVNINGYPSDFADNRSSSTQGSARLAMATREAASATVDPNSFSQGNTTQSHAINMVVRPA